MVSLRFRYISHTEKIQENNFYLHHKILQTQSKLAVDFIHLDEMRRIPWVLSRFYEMNTMKLPLKASEQ